MSLFMKIALAAKVYKNQLLNYFISLGENN
ncbi:hypothetical protein RCH18_001665 [Flavobacterium sp. PL11]|jgi:hypothetical protein|nr:hypothetical protein [Flavobacterium sp. PL11]